VALVDPNAWIVFDSFALPNAKVFDGSAIGLTVEIEDDWIAVVAFGFEV
jgi:hypothetical protein